MPLTTNIVEYETDGGKICAITIKYEANNDDRLSRGGFTAVNGKCLFTIPRKWLKPRYIDFVLPDDKVERVFYRTHNDWVDAIEQNKDNISKVCGECLSCTAIGALYAN